MAVDWSGRWNHIRKLTERTGPFAHPDFEPSTETLQFLQEVCKVLVIGAGGLGCELLKNLALLGIRNIDVIDMDTIDVSNLNRQFLFRPNDVGKTKAETAANFINRRIPGTNVTAHFAKIQDYDASFYRDFHIVVCGLDSIVARRWINGMLLSILGYNDGELDQSTLIPMVDGGTEGFKGNARVILPGITACVECTLDLYPPQINFPLCTIAHTPRLPEHCIEYVRILLWPKEEPFGAGVNIDGDDPEHINWILEKSQQRANEYNISGITYRLTQENSVIADELTRRSAVLDTVSSSFTSLSQDIKYLEGDIKKLRKDGMEESQITRKVNVLMEKKTSKKFMKKKLVEAYRNLEDIISDSQEFSEIQPYKDAKRALRQSKHLVDVN